MRNDGVFLRAAGPVHDGCSRRVEARAGFVQTRHFLNIATFVRSYSQICNLGFVQPVFSPIVMVTLDADRYGRVNLCQFVRVFPNRRPPAAVGSRFRQAEPRPFTPCQARAMYLMHLALGGCLKAPPVRYGITEDTGGHIAYLLGAAMAQAARPDVAAVDIVTRAFAGPGLDPVHATPEEPVAPGCRILRLRTPRGGYLSKQALEDEIPALTRAFLRMLAEMPRRPDVIHAHFADAARLARAARRAFGIRWIYTPHSLALQKGPDALGRSDLSGRVAAERRALQQADAVILSSRDEAERQIAPYHPDAEGRAHCIAPGVSLVPDRGPDAARALLAPFLRDADRPIVLAVARPVRKKNLGVLVEAFAGSAALREGANLVIVAGLRDGLCAGPSEQVAVLTDLVDRIDRHGLWGRVALPARHDADQLRALYSLAACGGVFVNPAHHEPFGLTLVEAAQAGVPVVATRNGGPVDIIAQLGHGALVAPEDPAAIAAACLNLMRDRGGVAEAQRRALRLFDWQGWASRATALCRGLAAPAAPAIARVPSRPARILACDIDGTLTGCRRGAARFGRWRQRQDDRLLLTVATGRSVSQARLVLQDWGLPRPDLFITSVGSEIWRWGRGDQLHLCRDYAALIETDWHPDAIRALLRSGMEGRDAARMGRWQAPHEQRAWKLSLLGDAGQAQRVRAMLAGAGLAARVIPSHGRFIDILPARAGKAAALAFEAGRHGLDLSACIAAGDSGNDADMLEASGAAILPANAYAETRGLRGAGLYRSPHAHAGGVLDGLARLGLAPRGPRVRLSERGVEHA